VILKCFSCGNENKENSKFCFKCGAKLAAAQVQQVVPTIIPEAVPVSPVTVPVSPVTMPIREDVATRPLSTASLLFKESGAEIQVPYKTLISIGRADKQAGYIPEIDLTEIDKSKVTSRKHGCITYINGIYKISDSGSLNGTFQNGVKLESGIEKNLKNGDEIIFGKLVSTFICKD
jgi:hypothetical protein